MKIAIHQPEHFPYMGFFDKMKSVDLFIILDDVQYTKNNWQNRNRFLNKNKVEEFFTVQVEKNANKKLIKDVNVVDGPWKNKAIKKLQQNFNINTPILFSSMFNISTSGSQRLADICFKVNATEYLSGLGGKKYLDESKFKCKVSYHTLLLDNYYSIVQNI